VEAGLGGGQPGGQMPTARQFDLQIADADVQHLFLRRTRSKLRVGVLHRGDLQLERWGMTPQQQISELVHQRDCMHGGRLWVHALHGEGQREIRAAMGAVHRAPYRFQHRWFFVLEPRFHGGLWPEGAKKWRDPHHHQRFGHGLSVGYNPSALMPGCINQDLQGHQRIVRNGFGDAMRIDLVLVGAKPLEGLGGTAQNGNLE